MEDYWSNIATVDSYYNTNMDFLKPEVRDYFFRETPHIYSKVDDYPPAKYNAGSDVKNSLISSGCIINSKIEILYCLKCVCRKELCNQEFHYSQ